MTELRYIGKPARRVDAADKVTGRARYVADIDSRDALRTLSPQ